MEPVSFFGCQFVSFQLGLVCAIQSSCDTSFGSSAVFHLPQEAPFKEERFEGILMRRAYDAGEVRRFGKFSASILER